jgi:hypothetical protein
LVFLIIACVFSSAKLEKRAEQVLPGSKRGGREREGVGREWGEMVQAMYARVNK